MKICCVSDLHGNLPKIPECDLLLIAGDIVPVTMHEPVMSAFWFERTFKRWLDSLTVPVIGVAGNHDFIFQEQPEDIPENLNWTYLQDSGTEFNGLKIWGSPWQPRFFNWAFNADEPKLEEKWSLIPDNIDILLLHGPPHGYGDFSPYDHIHTGSPSLLKKIQEIQPKLVVAGHIHSGYGLYRIGETIFVNASHLDEKYNPVNPLIVVEI